MRHGYAVDAPFIDTPRQARSHYRKRFGIESSYRLSEKTTISPTTTDPTQRLQECGVEFKQCRNTITGTDTNETDLIDGVELVPSGVGELARLQSEDYIHITP